MGIKTKRHGVKAADVLCLRSALDFSLRAVGFL